MGNSMLLLWLLLERLIQTGFTKVLLRVAYAQACFHVEAYVRRALNPYFKEGLFTGPSQHHYCICVEELPGQPKRRISQQILYLVDEIAIFTNSSAWLTGMQYLIGYVMHKFLFCTPLTFIPKSGSATYWKQVWRTRAGVTSVDNKPSQKTAPDRSCVRERYARAPPHRLIDSRFAMHG